MPVKKDPRDFPCSNCQAKPGEWCTQPNDNGRFKVYWFHYARMVTAHEEAQND